MLPVPDEFGVWHVSSPAKALAAQMLLMCCSFPLNSINCKYIFVPSYVLYFNCLLFSYISIYVFLFPSAKVLNFQGRFSGMNIFCFRREALKETQKYVFLATLMEENSLLIWLHSLFFPPLELMPVVVVFLKRKKVLRIRTVGSHCLFILFSESCTYLLIFFFCCLMST